MLIKFVTNRKLLNDEDEFLSVLESICGDLEYSLLKKGHSIDSVILREKDLDLVSYDILLNKVYEVTNIYNVPLFIHSHFELLGGHFNKIHLPIHRFREFCDLFSNDENFRARILDCENIFIGVSIHSKKEAMEVEQRLTELILNTSLNTNISINTYLTAGNLFVTTCKVGKPGIGYEIFKEIKNATSIPTYPIGGITVENLNEVGAKSNSIKACIMSDLVEFCKSM